MKSNTVAAVVLACSACALTAHAANVVVSDSQKVVLTTKTADGGDSVTLSSTDHSSYPAGLPTPSFWFDASDTEGWTLDGDAVKRIPSKTGTRSLTVETTGATWTGWGGGAVPQAPVLAQDAGLGANVVDFGAAGSMRGMIFDSDGVANRLASIGTAFFVYGSQQGGGWFFGGGSTALDWMRSTTFMGAAASTPYNPLAGSDADNAEMFRVGYTRHDGFPYIAQKVGFSGGWEVFTFAATNSAAAAMLSATGLGIGNTASGGQAASGGMKIAEMIVFDQALSSSEIAAVEDWLRLKWFGFAAPGVNGRSRAATVIIGSTDVAKGKTTTMTAAAGETLEIGRLSGGHNSSAAAANDDALTLTGAGAFSLTDASEYGGVVTLDGATLRFANRAIPTADTLPSGLLLRFDPSVSGSRTVTTVNGTNFVSRLDNLTSITYGEGHLAVSLRPTKIGDHEYDDRRPWLSMYRSPTGLQFVDFGPFYSWSRVYDTDGVTQLGIRGRNLRLYEGDVPNTSVIRLTTVVAVVDARRGGGWLMDQGFQRANQNGGYRPHGLLKSGNLTDVYVSLNAAPYLQPTDGSAYLDGERVASPGTTGYNPGMQVVALQVPGTAPNYVGAYTENVSGGLVVGEMLLWNRPLNETEIRDASAYLAKKWLGKTLPGYQGDSADAKLRRLVVEPGSKIEVSSGATVRIDKVTLNGDVVKSGGGTLEIGSLVHNGHVISAEGGAVKFVGALDVASQSSAAVNPAFRFDPTETNTWEFSYVNGANHVLLAGDYEHDLIFGASGYDVSKGPVIDFASGPIVAGSHMPVVDFGTFTGSGEPNTTQFALKFSRPMESVRSVYAVWKVADNTQKVFFMGSVRNTDYAASTRYDFHRADPATEYGRPLYTSGNTTSPAVKGGTLLVDGVVTNGTRWIPASGQWYLVEVHTAYPVHISAFALDRGYSAGGMSLGEVVAYDRALTDREKVATRNYMLKKWFGKADGELEPLPAAPDQESVVLPKMVVDGVLELASDASLTVRRVVGEGDIVKSGAGTLEVVNQQAYTGTVHVAEGTFRLTSHVVEGEKRMAEDGLLLQLDAGRNLTTTVNGARTEVLEWASANGSGWKAVSAKGVYTNAAKTATLEITGNPTTMIDAELGDSAVVDMSAGSTAASASHECFRLFNPNGEWAAVKGIATAFWVIGSQNGGGFVFGGGDHTDASGGNVAQYYAWHRGGNAGSSRADSLLSPSGDATIKAQTVWRVNGTQHGGTAANPLSGGWDVLSCRFNSGHSGFADALACDGRIFIAQDYRARCGNQRLAELLVYTNRLSDAELGQTEAYLAAKWGVNGAVSDYNRSMSAVVSEGAVFDCGGYPQYLASLSGEGTVDGDVTVGAIVKDCSDDSALTVTGTLTLEEGLVVTLTNASGLNPGDEVVVASADSIVFEGDASAARVVGGPDGMKFRLRRRGGNLVARVLPGLMIIVR